MSFLIRVLLPDAPGSLGQLADAYDSGRGTIGRVKGSALLRDVRDRLELASRTRR